jgi:hypothetical protein
MKLAQITAHELVLLVQEQIISVAEAREALGADIHAGPQEQLQSVPLAAPNVRARAIGWQESKQERIARTAQESK